MGINIGICELEAENAKCRKYKTEIVKVVVNDIKGLEKYAEIDEYVDLDDAKKLFPDWDDFMKRNRLNESTDAVYLVKVKKDDDLAKLRPVAKQKYTGWVAYSQMTDADKKIALERSLPENRVTGWDQLEMDETSSMCSSCPLSWDKGRGCIGAFGPDNSKLPEIAQKYNCPIVASAPESAKVQKKFSSSDAAALAKEVEILTKALPDEGKLFVRRYSGVLERLGAVADVCQKEKCSFFFF